MTYRVLASIFIIVVACVLASVHWAFLLLALLVLLLWL
jgi:hypothetical protein